MTVGLYLILRSVSRAQRHPGIGPEISESVKAIYNAVKVCGLSLLTGIAQLTSLKAPIEWEEVDVTPTLVNGKTAIPETAIQSVKKNTVALKGRSTHLCSLSQYLSSL